MKQLLRYLMTTIGLMLAGQALAFTGHCTADNTLTYPFDADITQSVNTTGHTTPWVSENSSTTYTLGGGCDAATTYYSAQPAPGVTYASTDSDGVWFNIQNNNYIQVALRIKTYNYYKGVIPNTDFPFTDFSNDCDYRCTGSATTGRSVQFRFRIKKKFVGASYILNQPIAYIYANQGATGLGFGEPIAIVSLSSTVTVPQSCTLTDPDTQGNVISFDFGTVSAQSFLRAGAGQKPASVSPKKKTIGITCNNIDAQTTLTLRIQGNTISGNSIVSDNPDIGFVLANSNGSPLTPNNANSVIPFTLDDNDSATATIQAWPVSVTGKQPAAGLATALGYLRMDFQ